jgi:hypothetical protein
LFLSPFKEAGPRLAQAERKSMDINARIEKNFELSMFVPVMFFYDESGKRIGKVVSLLVGQISLEVLHLQGER